MGHAVKKSHSSGADHCWRFSTAFNVRSHRMMIMIIIIIIIMFHSTAQVNPTSFGHWPPHLNKKASEITRNVEIICGQ